MYLLLRYDRFNASLLRKNVPPPKKKLKKIIIILLTPCFLVSYFFPTPFSLIEWYATY